MLFIADIESLNVTAVISRMSTFGRFKSQTVAPDHDVSKLLYSNTLPGAVNKMLTGDWAKPDAIKNVYQLRQCTVENKRYMVILMQDRRSNRLAVVVGYSGNVVVDALCGYSGDAAGWFELTNEFGLNPCSYSRPYRYIFNEEVII